MVVTIKYGLHAYILMYLSEIPPLHLHLSNKSEVTPPTIVMYDMIAPKLPTKMLAAYFNTPKNWSV